MNVVEGMGRTVPWVGPVVTRSLSENLERLPLAPGERRASMPNMFRIHMLPTAHSDCSMTEYGSIFDVYRILIDGGVGAPSNVLRAELQAFPEKQRIC